MNYILVLVTVVLVLVLVLVVLLLLVLMMVLMFPTNMGILSSSYPTYCRKTLR